MKYKHIIYGNIIESEEYETLSKHEQGDYNRIDSNGDFITSTIIGAATDSAILGGLLGGDIIGGIFGDLLDGDL